MLISKWEGFFAITWFVAGLCASGSNNLWGDLVRDWGVLLGLEQGVGLLPLGTQKDSASLAPPPQWPPTHRSNTQNSSDKSHQRSSGHHTLTFITSHGPLYRHQTATFSRIRLSNPYINGGKLSWLGIFFYSNHFAEKTSPDES